MNNYNIYDTVLCPEYIADKVIWDAIETDGRGHNLTGIEIAVIALRVNKKLCSKAERLYKTNDNFRKQINDKRKDQRETLGMFMNHWVKGILKNNIQGI